MYEKQESEKGKIEAALEAIGFRKKIHIRLDDDLHQRLRRKVADENTTIQNYLVALLRKALEPEVVE